MGQLGKYSYPNLGFDEVIRIVRKFSKELKGSASSPHALAELLGQKARSGSFNSKLADLRKYGVLENRGLKLTSLGEKVATPINENEANEAIKEAILNIELWKEIYIRFKENIPETNLPSLLIDITGAKREDVVSQAGIISKIYKEAISHIGKESFEEKYKDMKKQDIDNSPVPENIIELRAGDMHMRLPRTKSNIKLLISFLENMENEGSKK